MNIVNIAREVFDLEIKELMKIRERIDESFSEIVDVIYNTKGKVVFTGIGKSGIIAKKIAASMASTGTSSFFMQSAEGLHGDLGMINNEDIVIAVSNSGTSQEVLNIIPSLHKIGCKIIAMTGDRNSQLAIEADYILDIKIENEACPLNLAPTTSTTATLLVGDALTVALLKKRNFKRENFALFHPGGALGRRLLTRVSDIMSKNIPCVLENDNLNDIIYEISSKRLGLTTVKNINNDIIGIITDGDIRRCLLNKKNIENILAKDIVIKDFKKINSNKMANEAWRKMNENNISSLIAIEDDKVVGIITMHDVFEFNKREN